MNNNRGNNRRRGRGNSNPSSNGRPQNGNSQINRIDSRARGNAPQLLEKYRKLAQDAHMNGDRVQAEYYLQFADHYFRVLADARVRQDEQRARQNGGAPTGQGYPAGGSVSGDRWQDQDGDEDIGEESMDPDFPTFERVPQPRREEREPRRDEREPRRDEREARRDEPRRDEPREYRDTRERNGQREPRENREPRNFSPEPGNDQAPAEGTRAAEGEPISPTSDNPFIRDARGPRGPRGRNDRQPGRRNDGDAPRVQRNDNQRDDYQRNDNQRAEAPRTEAPRADAQRADAQRADAQRAEIQRAPVAPVVEPALRFDPASLPPAIGARSDGEKAPTRTERLRIPRAPAAEPVAAPVTPAPAPAPAAVVADAGAPADAAPAPKKRGRPRKNVAPETQPAAEG